MSGSSAGVLFSDVVPDGLELLGESHSDGELVQELCAPANSPAFAGHFPTVPVLPGVTLLEWAANATHRLRGADACIVGVEALKFAELLLPDLRFQARLETPPDRGRTRFEITREGRTVASGRIRLAAAPEALDAPPIDVPELGSGSEHPPAREVLPQEPPMVFLDQVLLASEEQTVCSLRVEELDRWSGPPGLPAWAAVEPMAQCIAARGGLEARRAGLAPPIGFLLGCRRLQIGVSHLSPRGAYAVSASRVFGRDKGLFSFECDVFEREEGRRLLSGRLNAYLPTDEELRAARISASGPA